MAGFSKGVIAVYKEEKRNKLDDDYQLSNVTKLKVFNDRVTRILINTLKGELLVLGRQNKVKIVDMATWTLQGSTRLGNHPIKSMQMDEAYNLAVAVNTQGEMLIIDLTHQKPTVNQTIEVSKGNKIGCLDCDIDSGKVVVALEDTGKILLYDIEFPFSAVCSRLPSGQQHQARKRI